MARIQSGRNTHAPLPDGTQPTVFLIGMRVNSWWRIRSWLPTFAAMGPMIAELSRDPDSGFLGTRYLIGYRGPTLIQYWRSTDDIYRYASDANAKHRPAWSAFYARARKAQGAVGVWHETYQVSAAESLYFDMPPTGLAAALGSEQVTAATASAAKRLRRSSVA